MAVVTMYIEKFGREVLIDDAHPLVVAQHAANAKTEADAIAAKAVRPARSRTAAAPPPDVEPEGS